MIMLVPLVAAGVLLLLTRRTYLVDVATADVSERGERRLQGRRAGWHRQGTGTGAPARGRLTRRVEAYFLSQQKLLRSLTLGPADQPAWTSLARVRSP